MSLFLVELIFFMLLNLIVGFLDCCFFVGLLDVESCW